MGKTVVVTGGAGFIGAHVCTALARADVDVRVLDDLSTGSLDNLAGLGLEFLEGSILDAHDLSSLCRGADALVHLAARPSVSRSVEDPVATSHVNVMGTLQVLEAARFANLHVVLASSSSVYGASQPGPRSESTVPHPLSPYAASKLATESYARAYAHCYSLSALVFRFFNVFGPLQRADHDYAAVIPRFIWAALSGRIAEVHGDGLQTRDFTFVRTVADIVTSAVLDRVTYQGPVNLAYGTRTSILELLDILEPVLGVDVRRQHVKPRDGDVRDSRADNSILRGLFPDIAPVDLTPGLIETADWLKAQTHPEA